MQRYTRITMALLLSAGLMGWTVGASHGAASAAKHRLVQQSGQTAQPGERSTGAQNRPESDTSRVQEQMSGAAGQAQDQAHQMSQQAQGAMGGQQFTPGQLPQGFTAKNFDNSTKDVRDTLGSLAKAVFKKDNYNDLIDNFAQSDRDRLKTSDNSYGPQLDQAIDQFQTQWQAKFKNDFGFNADQALSDQALSVTTGQVSNPEQIQNWPITLSNKSNKQYGKPSMNRDTNIAVATLNTGTDNYNVSLVREGNDWKIDIPDTLNADKLKTNLAQHLTEVSQMANQWPTDWVQAQRVVVSHILMALYDVNEPQQGQQQQGAQQGQQGQQQEQQGAQQGQQPQQQQQQEQQRRQQQEQQIEQQKQQIDQQKQQIDQQKQQLEQQKQQLDQQRRQLEQQGRQNQQQNR